MEQRGVKITSASRLFGHCRQAYYQYRLDIIERVRVEQELLTSVRAIRDEDPHIGCYKLWLMMKAIFGYANVPGRDSFFSLLRRNRLILPPPRVRHTTNSNHRYHKWKNLIVDFSPECANRLWVSDITYIALDNGVCYLHLVTDAYSRKIIGWVLSDSLKSSKSLQALRQAINQALDMSDSVRLDGLIHHSDRGVQYCCDAYVACLKQYGISISMTEDYKPTDNAIAERINGIIKSECVYPRRHFQSIDDAREIIGRYIHFYNHSRPHMSIGMKVPAIVHMEQGEQRKMWKNKFHANDENTSEENNVSLQKTLDVK